VNTDNAHIIAACKKQDRVAQQKLFSLYNQALYKSAYMQLSDDHSAKEVTQQTWIDIFRGLDKYDSSKSQIITWMKTILIRKIWKHYKDRFEVVDIDQARTEEQRGDKIISKISCDELLKEMDRIPEISRMVFKLYVLEGYKHNDIAQVLGITESTSRVHLSKARKVMKQRYLTINKITG